MIIEVTSPINLTDQEKASISKELRRLFGDTECEFSVDPMIYSGLIIKKDSKVIDLSIKGLLMENI
jgi:F0F1-type ATP synthase delta subunit